MDTLGKIDDFLDDLYPIAQYADATLDAIAYSARRMDNARAREKEKDEYFRRRKRYFEQRTAADAEDAKARAHLSHIERLRTASKEEKWIHGETREKAQLP